MTLLTVIQDVCAAVGVARPQAIFARITSDRTLQEMVALANEMAQRIAYDTREWTKLKASASFTGDGHLVPPTPVYPDPPLPPEVVQVFVGTTAFDLPANYKRMLVSSNMWRSTSSQQPMTFIPDTDQWLIRRFSVASNTAWGEWTIIGGQVHIFPIMAVGTSAFFTYLDKNCINLNAGGYGDRFVKDDDSFALDERLLKLGMIWQWKAHKGTPYAEDMGTYGDALTMAMGADAPAPILVGRSVRRSALAGGWHDYN